jgi:hypothetical protein
MLASFVALLMVVGTAVAQERTPTTVPFDEALSVYVAHDGTWLNGSTWEEEEAEIEGPVAAFEAWEEVSDDLDVWVPHQINVPAIPEGWVFFDAVETEAMDLVVLIRDTDNRLGHVEIIHRDTGQPIGILQANPQGAEISGTVPVDPLIEAFNLVVKDPTGQTLMQAPENNPRIVDAVVFSKSFGWEPNCGDEHAPCPANPRTAPYGNPEQLDADEPSKATVPFTKTACAGGQEFERDAPTIDQVGPKYDLMDKKILDKTLVDPMELPGGLQQEALEEIRDQLAAAEAPFLGGNTFLEALVAKPYSRGKAHWKMTVYGEGRALIYFPIRLRTVTKLQLAGELESRADAKWPEALGTHNPSGDWGAKIGVTWTSQDQKKALPPEPLGNVWALRASSTWDPLALPEESITAPITFELWGDKVEPDGQPGYIGGTGTATRDAADVTPPPPMVPPSTVGLTFPWMGESKGRCEVQLAKGWKWKGTGTTGNPAYSSGTVDPFPVPTEVAPRINVTLQALLRLIVKTIDDQQGQPCAAMIELYKQVGEQWQPLVTGQMTSYDNGEYVWRYGVSHVPPGTYKVRARWPGWPPPPWTEDVIAVGPDIEVIRTLAVSPPGGG